MPAPVDKVELHLAKSFEELKRRSELPANMKNYNIDRMIQSFNNLLLEGRKALRSGDQERAFFMFFRFMSMFNRVETPSDRERFKVKIGTQTTMDVMLELERLTTELERRYTEQKQNYDNRKAQLFNKSAPSSTPPVPGTSVKVVVSANGTPQQTIGPFEPYYDEDSEEYREVDARTLIKCIESQQDIRKILIIDIRPSEQFEESAIAANKLHTRCEVNIINISVEHILPGLTCSALLRKPLLGLTMDALERRRSMDRVVILDGGSSQPNTTYTKPSKVILADALWKWDQSDRIKSKPYFLKGGFEDFAITFPMFITRTTDLINKGVQFPTTTRESLINSFEMKSLYNFEDEDDEMITKEVNTAEPIDSGNQQPSKQQLSTPNKILVNGYISPSIGNNNNNNNITPTSMNGTNIISTNNGLSNNFPQSNTGFSHFTSQLSKVPGVAMPVIPDRSSKPKFEPDTQVHNINNTANNKLNKIDNDNDITMAEEDMETNEQLKPQFQSASAKVNNNNRYEQTPKSSLLNNLPPKPLHLVSSFKQPTLDGISGATINGYNQVPSDGLTSNEEKQLEMTMNSDDDDLVAGKFDDLKSSIRQQVPPQTPVHKRGKATFKQDDEDMSEDETSEDEQTNNMMEINTTTVNRSKPILMNGGHNRPNNVNNYSAPSSLSRSLSSPNIAQLDNDSQQFSYHSVGASGGSGTPKFPQQPLVDRSVKPSPYQARMLKNRDFSPQYSSTARLTGLRNLGNTCFMNSILQCLNNTTELSDYLRKGNVHINLNSKFGSNGELTIELIELFKQMTSANFKHISPKDLKNAVIKHIPDFVEYKQQDAHEFLVRFLDRVHADLNQNINIQVNDPVKNDPNYYDKLSITAAANSFWTLHLKRHKSIITNLFEGLIVSTLKCNHCGHTSKALEAFTCLSLPIQEGGRTSIQTSLKMFLRREQISDEWICPICKQKRAADKCTYIYRLPKILVIHLKRFSYDGLWRQKICTFVDFPIDNLEVEAHDGQTSSRSYSLYGVVNHTGTLEGGHYISYSRNLEHNIGWHRYDDQEVTPASSGDVITQNAYVLFYRMKSAS